MRDGMEALVMDNAKMEALGIPGFGPEFSVDCANHGGPGLGAVQQWDADSGTWSLISEFAPSDMTVIQPLIDEDSSAFAEENKIEVKECA